MHTDLAPTTHTSPVVERQLGAFENLFDLYTQVLPVQFSIIATIDRPLEVPAVRLALAELQRAQPMLAVRVDRSSGDAHFAPTKQPIPLSVQLTGLSWETIAANEQTHPIDLAHGPLARCAIQSSSTGSTIVMTFSHQIADGLSATAAIRALVRSLNGYPLRPAAFPPAQETLLAALDQADAGARAATSSGPGALVADDADRRMGRRGAIRPFDGAAPHVQSLVWPAELTTAAIAEAHAQSTTLHALLTAATIHVMHASGDRDFISVMNPMNTRRATGSGETLALYFLSTRYGVDRSDSAELWPLARAIRSHIRAAQTPQHLAAASRGMSAGAPYITTPDNAVEAMVSFANYDLMVTNLGTLDTPERAEGPREAEVTDLFGPVMATQIQGEQILALSSFKGRLRTTITTRTPIAGFLTQIRDEVQHALSGGTLA